jgi:hypothetical protein
MPKGQHYRHLAHEVRERAIIDEDSRRMLEEIASRYDALAIGHEGLDRSDQQEGRSQDQDD